MFVEIVLIKKYLALLLCDGDELSLITSMVLILSQSSQELNISRRRLTEESILHVL